MEPVTEIRETHLRYSCSCRECPFFLSVTNGRLREVPLRYEAEVEKEAERRAMRKTTINNLKVR